MFFIYKFLINIVFFFSPLILVIRLIKEKEELETTLTKLIEEKSELEDLVEDLKKAKDKNEVLEIVKKHSDTTEFEEFQELCQNVEYQ